MGEIVIENKLKHVQYIMKPKNKLAYLHQYYNIIIRISGMLPARSVWARLSDEAGWFRGEGARGHVCCVCICAGEEATLSQGQKLIATAG